MRRLALVFVVPLVLTVIVAGCGSGNAGPGLRGTVVDPPEQAPVFTLSDQHGRSVSLADQKGKVVLVAFLYTRCPDVCPIIASTLSKAVEDLGADRDRARVIAISVDPEGDTPERVRAFIQLRQLVDEFLYLSGSRSELLPVWKGFHVAVFPDVKQTIAHSTFELLLDGQGRIRARYDAQTRPVDLVHDMRALLAESE
jgi:protein SCO1/2